nr:hypothetical protein [Tanacetum cinerariifolium]
EDLEEDPEEEPEDDDDDMEMDDEAEKFKEQDHHFLGLGCENIESKIVLTGPMCLNLGTAWKRLGKMEKLMSERIDTEGRIRKKFIEQYHHFIGLGCDNIEMDRTVRNVMSDLSGLKKLVKGLSDRFDEYERSKVFKAKRVLEKEDAAIAAAAVATSGINDDDDDTAPMDSQPHEPHGSPHDTQ